ncbi:MAG: nucleoside transporter C-terminal domain-containing protein [Candidatus Melainabacteria bacterium]|nr:nucleoside transporter C-terminal domain-containing protein [Candidatus Melainabacteria bacterium]
MEHWIGLLGIVAILGLAVGLSRYRTAIDWHLVISGLALQGLIAVFVLKVPLGQAVFHQLGVGIEAVLSFARQGAGFVFGPLVSPKMAEVFGAGNGFVFALNLVPTIIFVACLVSVAYHVGLLQQVVKAVAWLVYRLMGASGAEALSNAASAFVGQVEAQLLIKPFVGSLTQSELLSVMSGSMACIAGAVMAIYIQMGVPAEYLLAASLMAIPGALVISKIVLPETALPLTRGQVTLTVERETVNLIDAAAQGCADGLRIGLNVCAMLIGFIALIGLIDAAIGWVGLQLHGLGWNATAIGVDLAHLSLKGILGSVFAVVALLLGVPAQEASIVGGLMGTKLVINEFVAYADLAPMLQAGSLSPRAVAVASFALCGFANFSSVAMQIGGIGEIAPTRKRDLARLGLWALLCGSLASYLSSALAGLLVYTPGSSSPGLLETAWGPWALMAVAALVILACQWHRQYRPPTVPMLSKKPPLSGLQTAASTVKSASR